MAALDRLAADSVVGARPDLIFHLRTNDESVRLQCYGRTITFPARAAEAVGFALNHSDFAVGYLPDLDDSGKLTLVRRLIREGLLIIV